MRLKNAKVEAESQRHAEIAPFCAPAGRTSRGRGNFLRKQGSLTRVSVVRFPCFLNKISPLFAVRTSFEKGAIRDFHLFNFFLSVSATQPSPRLPQFSPSVISLLDTDGETRVGTSKLLTYSLKLTPFVDLGEAFKAFGTRYWARKKLMQQRLLV